MPYLQRPEYSMADVLGAQAPALRVLASLLMPEDPVEASMDMVHPLSAMVRMPLHRPLSRGVKWLKGHEIEAPIVRGGAYNPTHDQIVINRKAWKNEGVPKSDKNPGPPLKSEADKNARRRYTLRHEEGHGVYENLPETEKKAFNESADLRMLEGEGDDVQDYYNWWERRMAPNDAYIPPRSDYSLDERFTELFADIFAGSHEPETMMENMRRILDNPEAERILRALLESEK